MGYLMAIILVGILVAGLLVTNNSITIREITPRYFTPGTELTIMGGDFGVARNGNSVLVNGDPLPQYAYSAWSSDTIVIRMPRHIHSGVVEVKVGQNMSNRMLIASAEYVNAYPRARETGELQILSHTPLRISGGDIVTLEGIFVGEDLRLYFITPQSPARRDDQDGREGLASELAEEPSSELPESGTFLYELEEEHYISRNLHAISLRVPSGMQSGNLFIRNNHTVSTPYYLEIDSRIGSNEYHSPLRYTLNYGAHLGEGGEENYALWMPIIPSTILQPEQDTLFMSEQFQYAIDNNGYFYITPTATDTPPSIRISALLTRFAQRSIINRALLTPSPTLGEYRLEEYLSNERWLAVNDEAAAPHIASSQRIANFYLRAEAIYRRIIAYLAPHQSADRYIVNENSEDAEAINPAHIARLLPTLSLTEEYPAAAVEYALLAATLLRSSGIPSRVITGIYIIDAEPSAETRGVTGEGQAATMHYWNEFFLPGFGWLPFDSAMGDGMHRDGEETPQTEEDFYFGNTDNRRVVLSKDIHEIPRYTTNTNVYRFPRSRFFFTHHIEAQENIDINSFYLYPVVVIKERA